MIHVNTDKVESLFNQLIITNNKEDYNNNWLKSKIEYSQYFCLFAYAY